MKKIFNHIYIVIMALIVFFSTVSVFASNGGQITGTTDSGLTYRTDATVVVITGYTGTSPDITIPSDINGVMVTGIAESAFENNTVIKNVTINADIRNIPDKCFLNSSVVSITLPAKVRTIGSKAFADCIALTKIVLPNGLQKIEREAFLNCSSLASVVIPEGVVEIKEYAFKNCSNIAEVSLPSTLTRLGTESFSSCVKLSQVSMPANLTEISWGAFYSCTGLKKAILPANQTIIYPSMFQGCTSLKEIILPGKLEYIGNEAFEGCASLERINIPDSCTTIMAAAFKNCTSLKEITLPPRLEEISGGEESNGTESKGMGAFYGCTSLKSVVIPDGCKAIWNTAFKNCTSLSSVYIPASVTSIAEDAFDNCYFMIVSAPKGSTGLQFAKNNYFRYIELNSGAGGEAFNGQISAGVIEDLKESEKLSILSGDISIIFDEKSVVSIKAQSAGSTIEFQYQLPNAGNIGQGNLKKAIREVLNIGGKVMDLHLINASKSNADVLFGKNGGNVTITVPYSAPSGATGVTLYYIDEAGNQTEIRGTYNSEEKTVTFTTNHFSYYSIVPLGVKAPQTTPAETESTKPESTKPNSTEEAKPESTGSESTESESTILESTELESTELESTELESTESESTELEPIESETTEMLPSEKPVKDSSKDGIGIGTVILIAVLSMVIGVVGCWFAYNYYIKIKGNKTEQ